MKLGRAKLDLGRRRTPGNRHDQTAIILIVASWILLCPTYCQSDGGGSIWDKPFSSPQYLIHATGHGTMDGPRVDDWWFLFPRAPNGKYLELPDGSGGTFNYTVDHSFGPFSTPAHVCAACSAEIGDRSLNAWGSDDSFSCKDLAAQSGQKTCSDLCKENNPGKHVVWDGQSQYPDCACTCENGYHFDGNGDCVQDSAPATSGSAPGGTASGSGSTGAVEVQVITNQGTTVVKPGEGTRVALPPGGEARIIAICREAYAKYELYKLVYEGEELVTPDVYFTQYFSHSIASLCLGPAVGLGYEVTESTSTEGSAIGSKVELHQGSIRAEVVDSRVSLDIATPDVTVSSTGKNTFGVAYDPASEKSYVAAHQYPVQVQLTDSSQAPFILEHGEEIEVSSGRAVPITPPGQTSEGGTTTGTTTETSGAAYEGSEGGCYADPVTGEIVCVDSYGEPSTTQGEMQGGCYEDPETGEIVCVDSYGEPSTTQEETNQGEMQGGCYTDPATGETICVDSYGDPSTAQGEMQGGCYQDPYTGQIVCVDASDDFSNRDVWI